MVRTVYLDQNAWVNLARAHYHPDENPELKSVSDSALGASDRGIVFPLSIAHMVETTRLSNPRRTRLAEFMVKLSKGHTMYPYTKLLDLELHEAVCKAMGTRGLDWPGIVFGKGVSRLLGAKGRLTPKPGVTGEVPEDVKQKVLDYVDSPEMLLRGLVDPAFQNYFPKTATVDWIAGMERVRLQESQIADKVVRGKVRKVKFLADEIMPRLFKFQNRYGLPRDFIVKENWTPTDWENFLQRLPATYTSHVLTERRDRNTSRPIDPNDIMDIAALSAAIPYCDVVVTEKMFGAMAKDAHLDTLFKTQVLRNPIELASVL